MSSVITPKGNLKIESLRQKYKNAIKQEVQANIQDISSKKNENQFLIYVLSLAQEVVSSKKVDVVSLVIELILELIPHSPEDLAILQKNIKFLLENNLIQKVGVMERAWFYAKEFLKKKVL